MVVRWYKVQYTTLLGYWIWGLYCKINFTFWACLTLRMHSWPSEQNVDQQSWSMRYNFIVTVLCNSSYWYIWIYQQGNVWIKAKLLATEGISTSTSYYFCLHNLHRNRATYRPATCQLLEQLLLPANASASLLEAISRYYITCKFVLNQKHAAWGENYSWLAPPTD